MLRSIFEALDIFSNAFEITDDKARHETSLKTETHLHNHEIKVMDDLHYQERFIEKQIYLLSVYADIEAYCQELNENLIQNNRDAERDMVDQRNQQLQTVLIAGTIMLSAIVGVLFQAAFPDGYNGDAYYIYSITIALSIGCLVISMILCVELLVRIYRFTYKRSYASIKHLQRSLTETTKIEEKITGTTSGGLGASSIGGISSQKRKREELNFTNHTFQHRSTKTDTSGKAGGGAGPRKFSSLNENQIEDEWRNHEAEVEKYFRRRDNLNAELHRLVGGRKELSFETYWNQQCDQLNNCAVLSFYFGTGLNVIATIVFMYAYFDDEYNVVKCSYAISVIIGFFFFVMITLVIGLQTDPMMEQLNRSILRAESEIVYSEGGRLIFGNETKLTEDYIQGEDENDEEANSNNHRSEKKD